jgi:hypothetical protein
MKYIEELSNGDCFDYDGAKFLLTADFRKNGDKLAYSASNGTAKWFSGQTIVEICPIYTLDNNNNIIPIKITTKADVAL